MKNSTLYVSEAYKSQTMQTESSYISYFNNNDNNLYLATVKYFVIGTVNCVCDQICVCVEKHFAIIRPIVSNAPFQAVGDDHIDILITHIFQCNISDNFIIIPIEWLWAVCMHILVDELHYVYCPLNDKELE